jgi:hypothetical protein
MQRAVDAAEKARSELRSLLMTHLSLLDRNPAGKTDAVPSVNGIAAAAVAIEN